MMENDILRSQLLYHGTSSALELTDGIIRPAIETCIQRENRKTLLDKVFLTHSKVSAFRYAMLACEKYGGSPVVYIATPNGVVDELANNEVICDYASVFYI